MSDKKVKDMVVIGGGPAGLTAALYGARARLDLALYEKGAYGGQMTTTAHIENYPGFPDGIGGFELADLMQKQAESFGLVITYDTVNSIRADKGIFRLDTGSGEVASRSVLVSTGATPNRLGVPGEEKLTGRGVSYCATCDGALYRDRVVAVVGGGDSAVEEAIFLTRFAREVHIIHRRDELRAVPLVRDRALANEKITMQWSTVVEEISGDDEVRGIALKDVKDGSTRNLAVDGVFIYVGIKPQTDCLVKTDEDESGYIVTDLTMSSSLPGLYAAGDVRRGSIRQVSSAVGDGATAANYIYKYLEEG